MTVKVLTDSTSYIDEATKQILDIRTVSLNVEFPDATFKEMEINNETFYKMMTEKGIPKSSQPSIGDLYKEMEAVVKEGDSLLGVFLSSAMSGTYGTAHMTRDMILEKYPEATIEILDSRSNCMQLGFAVTTAARAAKENQTIEDVIKVAKDNINRSRFLFIPDNLEYLEKGGRIGKANAIIGNLLKIIPILTVEDGMTTVYKKVRKKNKAVLTMVEKLLKDINTHGMGEIVVHHINCLHEAKTVVNKIKESIEVDIKIQDIGPVIGLHVGPGAIGIAYYTEEDMR